MRAAGVAEARRDRTAIGVIWDAEQFIADAAQRLNLTIMPAPAEQAGPASAVVDAASPEPQSWYPETHRKMSRHVLAGMVPEQAWKKVDPLHWKAAGATGRAPGALWKMAEVVHRTRCITEGLARAEELTEEDWKLYRELTAMPETDLFKALHASANMVRALRARSKKLLAREPISLFRTEPVAPVPAEPLVVAPAAPEPERPLLEIPRWVGVDPRKQLTPLSYEACCGYRVAFGGKKPILTPAFIAEHAETKGLSETTVKPLLRSGWRRLEFVLSDDTSHADLNENEQMLRSKLQSRHGGKSTLGTIIRWIGGWDSFRPTDFNPIDLILKADWHSEAHRQARYTRRHGHYVMSTGGPRGRSVSKRGH